MEKDCPPLECRLAVKPGSYFLRYDAMRCDAMRCDGMRWLTSHGCFCSKSFAGVGHKSTDVNYSLSICHIKIGIAGSMNWAFGPHHGPASVEVKHHLAIDWRRSFLQLVTVRKALCKTLLLRHL